MNSYLAAYLIFSAACSVVYVIFAIRRRGCNDRHSLPPFL